MAEVGKAWIPVSPDLDGFDRDAERQLGGKSGKLGGVGKTIGAGLGKAVVAGAVVAVAAVGGAAAIAAPLIGAASELNETVSKSDTVFKESAGEIRAWADTAAASFGQSKQQALASASSFGNMFSQLGIGSAEASKMSRSMTELASDFASFHNADITEVLAAQEAAFRGEYDSVQKFVPTINAAAVEQKALEMGLAETTKELDAQDKALATQELLLSGAGDAMGDFARTNDSLANRTRIASAMFDDMKASLGNRLLPVATEVMGYIIDAMPTIEVAVGKAFDVIDSAISAVAPVLTEVAGGVRAFIAAFQAGDGDVTSNGLAGMMERVANVLRTAWDWVQANWPMFRDTVVVVLSEIVAWVVERWPEIEATILQAMTSVQAVVVTVLSFLQAAWENHGERLVNLVTVAFGAIMQAIRGALQIVQGIITVVLSVIRGDWGAAWDGIKLILSGALDVIKAVVRLAFEILKTIIGAAMGWVKQEIGDAWNGIISTFSSIGSRIGSALSGVASAITSPFRSAFSAIAGLWNRTVGSISFEVPDWVPGMGGKGFDVPNIPTAANGAVLTEPTLLIAGEYRGADRNPELVAPRDMLVDAVADGLGRAGSGPRRVVQIAEWHNHAGRDSWAEIDSLERMLGAVG